MIIKAYKYRIYPSEIQIEQLQINFTAKRFVWNYFLKLNMDRFEAKEGILNYNKMSALLTKLKNENIWLKDAEKSVLQNTLKDLSTACLRYLESDFKWSKKTIEHAARTGKILTFYDYDKHPKFKSWKDNYKSCEMNFTTTTAGGNIRVKEKEIKFTSSNKYKKQNCKIQLPKLSNVKIAYSRQFQGRILSATVSNDVDDKYYLSLCCTEVEIEMAIKTNEFVGLDVGIKHFLTTSDGNKTDNPKYYSKYEKKLLKEQRRLSKKKFMQDITTNKTRSQKFLKQRVKVAKIHRKIANCREDFIHKLTTKLVNKYDIICIENLNVSDMIKNHKFSKSIADVCWSKFRTILTYKSIFNDKNVIAVDTFFPSSQLCNVCHHQELSIKDVNIRKWICPKCKTVHDRDKNAAVNILVEGLRIYKETISA
ncbi:MAG: RNA-guided endonuclease TnpB family protein [Clostridium sp.]|uniref:RNA-guided endonuclease TnpB family protein n=1 Tax=Clostridium sp. TaxID=1506 RepID=UPI003D6C8940